MLEWVAVSFSRGYALPRNQTCVSCIPALQADSLPLALYARTEQISKQITDIESQFLTVRERSYR